MDLRVCRGYHRAPSTKPYTKRGTEINKNAEAYPTCDR